MTRTSWLVITLALGLAVQGLACDDGGDGDADSDLDADADADGDADGDADADGEVDADADADGDAGTDADQVEPPPCPAEPPADEASCEHELQSCWWQRCESAEAAVFEAVCRDGAWELTEQGCEGAPCGHATCAAAQVCHETRGGALLQECVDNPCGTGPLEPACACALCGTAECTVSGLLVICNSCPGGDCP